MPEPHGAPIVDHHGVTRHLIAREALLVILAEMDHGPGAPQLDALDLAETAWTIADEFVRHIDCPLGYERARWSSEAP